MSDLDFVDRKTIQGVVVSSRIRILRFDHGRWHMVAVAAITAASIVGTAIAQGWPR